MNSRQVRRQFRAMWRDACASRPALATDKPAMREAFSNYVDMLHRDGVTLNGRPEQFFEGTAP